MSMLIDSIMKKYYIPPLLFAIRMTEDGSKVHVCIDGKQRLTSIARFTQNQIPYLDDSTGSIEEVYFNPSLENSQVTHKDNIKQRFLSEADRDTFNDMEILMLEFHDLDEDEELEIFARVQMGVSITGAEKLLATNSEASKLCRSLLKEHETLDHALQKMKVQPFQYVAQLMFMIHEDSDKFVATPKKLMDFLKDRHIVLADRYKRVVKRTIKTMDEVFKNQNANRALYYYHGLDGTSTKSHLKNIEFIIFGYYITQCKKSIKAPELASDLIDLRRYLKEEYSATIHTGNPCWSAGREWVKRRLASKKRRTTPAASTMEYFEEESDNDDDDDDDDDSSNDLGTRALNSANHHQQILVPPSKRRRGPSLQEYIDTKPEHITITPSSTTLGSTSNGHTNGHTNGRGKALARRGGKRSLPYARQ
ncbi:uncharacterized protein BX664DRAFT_125120 [Halteromyces radiatus]|uniref:uncharacterized protein n=1 Tax=Halteromyces radiatus TaxID=101107 RepID=UPI00221FA5F8|nr:uncharacterized protein BX664DRAFT_125120 [Halteromyces radiatus]KAI8088986.1 hypothetical protein BX664DRAFT_125120 [Halteromyces radiatus]